MKKNERKSIGITRPLDKAGRVVIPSEIRKELDIIPDDILEIKMVVIDKNKKVIEITKKEE